MVEGKSKGKRRLDIECMRILAAFLIIRKQQDFFYFHIMICMELDIGCICLFLFFVSFQFLYFL